MASENTAEIKLEASPPSNSMPERYPETGIDVLVVGAGVAGLATALECWRKGHTVRLLERSLRINTAGDIFTIGLSGLRFIAAYPEMQKELEAISFPDIRLGWLKHTGEEVLPPKQPPKFNIDGFSGPPMSIQSRPLFHKMLYNQIYKLGIQVKFSKRAVEFFESSSLGKAFVRTDDGVVESGDIIIAADGIGSKSQALVAGQEVESKSTGLAVYRTAYPLSNAMEDALVRERFGLYDGQHPIMFTHLGPNVHTKVFAHNNEMTWSLTHRTTESARESWNHAIPIDEVLKTLHQISDWDPAFEALVKTTPECKTINFPLIWRDPQPKWTSPEGRVLQVGDAAHSFLPTSGNGATQALEDAVTIASCLQLAKDKVHVALATKAHNKLRFERVSCAQLLGFVNAQITHHTDWEAVKQNPMLVKPKTPKWIFMHDPEKYVYENYDKVMKSFGGDGSFENTNIPTGYKYKPWSIESLMSQNQVIELEGDWS